MSQDEIIRGYYNSSRIESDRLEQTVFKLEKERTQELILRYLQPGMTVADIGGGAGAYSFWLQQMGHAAHLLDAADVHIEMARQKAKHLSKPLASVKLGDARALPYTDESFEMVLMLGPLYHLQEEKDRIQSIREAGRVLKKGGVILAATISRYASLMDGFWRNLISDTEFLEIMSNDLRDGMHNNPTENPEYFTEAFFHTQSQIESEFRAAGFSQPNCFAIEGFGWLIPDFDSRWADESYREKLLQFIHRTETDPVMIGVSAHVMTIAFK